MDLPVVAEAASDPHIPLITTVPVPFTDEAGLAFLEHQAGRLHTDLGYSFAIVDAADDRAIGQTGLWLRNFDKGCASVDYWVVGSARGNGRLATRWAHWLRGLLTPLLCRGSSFTSNRGTTSPSVPRRSRASAVRVCGAAGRRSAACEKTRSRSR